MLNSFFSFFILVFSMVAFAGPPDSGWRNDTLVFDQGTDDKSDDKYQAIVERDTKDGGEFWMTVGTPTGSSELADQRGENEALDLNEGEGTTVKAGKKIAINLGRIFGKDKNKKARTEIVASQEGDCISNPTGPGCETPLEGKTLPSGTKGIKAQ